MKKLVVEPLTNTIYWSTVNEKNGTMSASDRVDVTDNATEAVLFHLMNIKDFETDGFAGYEYDLNVGGSVVICAINESKMATINRDDYEKLLDYKAKYEELIESAQEV